MKILNFTVITTSFNDSNNIGKYIEQIEKQTQKPTELIIVDGGSNDDTINKILEKSSQINDFKIRVISDRGRLNIAQGFNIGIQESKTDLMVIGGIGNEYDNQLFENLLQYQLRMDYDVVYGPIYGINATKFARIFNIAFVCGERGWDFGQASNHGVLIKKEVFEKYGYFLENFIYAGEDNEFFRRINKYNVKVGYNTSAKLFWETPTVWQEYIKKFKVNAIADLQEQPMRKIYINIISRLLMPFFIIGLFLLSYQLAIIICVLGLFFITYKIKSLNVLSIFLRLHFIFLPTYYYIKFFSVLKNKRIV